MYLSLKISKKKNDQIYTYKEKHDIIGLIKQTK
jgi:hypothetical protein